MTTKPRSLEPVKSFTLTWGQVGWEPFAILALALFSVLSALPAFLSIPGPESGNTLYLASQILSGKALYRDLWTAQFPLVYWIDALGLLLGGPAGWGVWLLQLVAVLGAGLGLFVFLRRFFGRFSAFLAVASLLCSLTFVFEQGNFPQIYGLFVQALALLLFLHAYRNPAVFLRWFTLGIVLGFALLLQGAFAGFVMVVGSLVLVDGLLRKDALRIKNFIWLVLGSGAVLGTALGIIAAQRAFPEFLAQVIEFNLFESGVHNPDRIQTVTTAFDYFVQNTGFTGFGLLSWLIVFPYLTLRDVRFRTLVSNRWIGVLFGLGGLAFLWFGAYDEAVHRFYSLQTLSAYRLGLISLGVALSAIGLWLGAGGVKRLLAGSWTHIIPQEKSAFLLPLAFALLDLPVEILCAGFAGQGQRFHWFAPTFPSIAILVSFLVWSLRSALDGQSQRAAAWVVQFGVLFILCASGFAVTLAHIPSQPPHELVEWAEFAREKVVSTDSILQWGSDARVYLQAQHAAFTPFSDLTPLFARGNRSTARIEAFLTTLQSTRPQFIVDTRDPRMPLLTTEPPAQCANVESPDWVHATLEAERRPGDFSDLPTIPPAMGKVYRWVCENYTPVARFGQRPWIVYRLRDGQ